MTEKEFIPQWIERIKKEIKLFPDEFINGSECENINMPGKDLIIAPPLFDSYEIVDSDGNIFFQTKDHIKAKYIIYSNRNKPNKISIPKSIKELGAVVKNYETHIDMFLKDMEKEFENFFPSSKNFYSISIQVFIALNITRL